MSEYRNVIVILLFSVFFTAASCSTPGTVVVSEEPNPGLQVKSTTTQTSIFPSEGIEPAPSPTSVPAGQDFSTHVFNELGISLEVPADLFVIKEPIFNPDDSSELDAYLFYIQNYGYPGGPSSGDFQVYGMLQFDLAPVSLEEFAALQDNPSGYKYVLPIDINGLRGFETQLAGERNNFVYLFYLDGHTLRIAVSSPTMENKDLAEKILNTIQVIQ